MARRDVTWRRWRKWAIGLGLWMLLIQIGFCAPPVYFATSTHAYVVDSETGRPIEGVIVVARWIMLKSLIVVGSHGWRMHVAETVTDARA